MTERILRIGRSVKARSGQGLITSLTTINRKPEEDAGCLGVRKILRLNVTYL